MFVDFPKLVELSIIFLTKAAQLALAFFCLSLVGFMSFPQIHGCMPTNPGMPPTTTTLPPGCCNPLVANQFANQTIFAYGVATITYDNNACRSTAIVTCSVPDLSLDLEASIRVDFQFYMIADLQTVQFPATCSNGVWTMGNPPLIVNQMECLLAESGTVG